MRFVLTLTTSTLLMFALLIAGCGGPSTRAMTTRVRPADLEVIANDASEALASSTFVNDRSPGDERVRLIPFAVRNMSGERLPRSAQWTVVRRMLFDPGMLEHLRSRGIDVLVMAERARSLNDLGLAPLPIAPADWDPTHHFNVTVESIARAGAAGGAIADERKDLFQVTFEVRDAHTGDIVWAGQGELARTARGRLVD